ncbi:MAG: efflux RND transporter periplasmic adaptor subunit [Bacteroidaceae bacterium]|nr:efflux RND transporter periplasmic adaptor subunit [Bacteroidaceae bacterium]
MRKIILIIAVTAIMAGCGESRPSHLSEGMGADSLAIENMDSQDNCSLPPQEGVGVSTMGKVVAAHYADLSFETALPIEKVLVKNGQQVRRGQTLAVLDQYKLRNAIDQQQRAIEQAQLQIEQAQLQMQDVIISQGYDPDKATSIPSDVRHHADVKSGYALANNQLATARTQLAAAQHELRSGVLTAPFDGVVANLSVQAHQLAQPGQTVCRVIATGDMEVEFRVMEADLSKYKIGTGVDIIPVADPGIRYKAIVSEINPVVDEQGAITLRAKLSDAQNLFDGMNVEVILEDKS